MFTLFDYIEPMILAVLCWGLLIGFFISLWILYMLDSRVYDLDGRLLPGPNHHLWGKNFLYALRVAQITRQYSQALCDILLNGIGDGDIVAFNSFFGNATVIIAHPDLVSFSLLLIIIIYTDLQLYRYNHIFLILNIFILI
jgi:hypothetical protein